MRREQDTIAQIATASGTGGVGIVRLSGAEAHRIGRALVGLDVAEERRMLLRRAREADGESIDRGLYVEFVGPRSLTGENVAEFHAHGGSVGLSRVLARCLALGARAAEAGEFMLRAFVRGKIDLAQAEAVAAAVGAQTEQAHRIAQQQYRGALSQRIADIRTPLVEAATELNADIEFPDEDLGSFDAAEIRRKLMRARDEVARLLEGFRVGRLLAHGATVAIIGPPNAGKSSLLNALVGYERAIVSPLAGTTRDTVEERAVIDGTAVRFVDTAGLRETGDAIEAAGVRRARTAMATADAVLAVLSADTDWAGFVRAEVAGLERVVWVWNKADAGPVARGWADVVGAEALSVSAKTGEGLEALKGALGKALLGTRVDGLPLVTIERHAVLLRETGEALEAAMHAIAVGASSEAVLVDVEISIHRLGELLGENVSEEVYREIFRRFCIGK